MQRAVETGADPRTGRCVGISDGLARRRITNLRSKGDARGDRYFSTRADASRVRDTLAVLNGDIADVHVSCVADLEGLIDLHVNVAASSRQTGGALLGQCQAGSNGR